MYNRDRLYISRMSEDQILLALDRWRAELAKAKEIGDTSTIQSIGEIIATLRSDLSMLQRRSPSPIKSPVGSSPSSPKGTPQRSPSSRIRVPSLRERLNQYGLQGVDVGGGGHCQFCAIGDRLGALGVTDDAGIPISKESAWFLRHKVVEHMINNRGHYKALLHLNDTAFNQYLQDMDTTTKWADNVVLKALSRIYGVNIIVITPWGLDGNILNYPVTLRNTLIIANEVNPNTGEGIHFVVATPRPDISPAAFDDTFRGMVAEILSDPSAEDSAYKHLGLRF